MPVNQRGSRRAERFPREEAFSFANPVASVCERVHLPPAQERQQRLCDLVLLIFRQCAYVRDDLFEQFAHRESISRPIPG